MNLQKILVMAGAAVLLSGLPATALEPPSVQLGKKLFTTPGLDGSTNGKTCNSCHPQGAKLQKAAANKDLANAINRCIMGPLGAKKTEGRSEEIKSLKLYIESLAKK